MIAGGAVSTAAVIAIFLSNIPESFSSTSAMKKNGRSAKYIFGVWLSIFLISGVASFCGYTIFKNFSPEVIAATIAVAAGAILAILSDTMMPEAIEEGHDIGVITVISCVHTNKIGSVKVAFVEKFLDRLLFAKMKMREIYSFTRAGIHENLNLYQHYFLSQIIGSWHFNDGNLHSHFDIRLTIKKQNEKDISYKSDKYNRINSKIGYRYCNIFSRSTKTLWMVWRVWLQCNNEFSYRWRTFTLVNSITGYSY